MPCQSLSIPTTILIHIDFFHVTISGILEPKIDNAEVGMKLAVTGMILLMLSAMHTIKILYYRNAKRLLSWARTHCGLFAIFTEQA